MVNNCIANGGILRIADTVASSNPQCRLTYRRIEEVHDIELQAADDAAVAKSASYSAAGRDARRKKPANREQELPAGSFLRPRAPKVEKLDEDMAQYKRVRLVSTSFHMKKAATSRDRKAKTILRPQDLRDPEQLAAYLTNVYGIPEEDSLEFVKESEAQILAVQAELEEPFRDEEGEFSDIEEAEEHIKRGVASRSYKTSESALRRLEDTFQRYFGTDRSGDLNLGRRLPLPAPTEFSDDDISLRADLGSHGFPRTERQDAEGSDSFSTSYDSEAMDRRIRAASVDSNISAIETASYMDGAAGNVIALEIPSDSDLHSGDEISPIVESSEEGSDFERPGSRERGGSTSDDLPNRHDSPDSVSVVTTYDQNGNAISRRWMGKEAAEATVRMRGRSDSGGSFGSELSCRSPSPGLFASDRRRRRRMERRLARVEKGTRLVDFS